MANTRALLLVLLLSTSLSLAFQQAHTNVALRSVTTKRVSSKRVQEIPQLNHCISSSPTFRKASVAPHDSNDDGHNGAALIMVFGGVPLLSLGLAFLLQANLIGPLIVAKRLYIYALAVVVVVVASLRGASDAPALGTRLIDLTREILPNFKVDQTSKNDDDQRFQEMAVLDKVDESAQAIGLPLLVVSSLVVSLFFVLLLQQTDSSTLLTGASSSPVLKSIQALLPNLITVSNGLVVSLFTRAELVRLPTLQDSKLQKEVFATVGSLILSALAFFGPPSLVWPIQNILCICLAIAVARAIQLPRLGPILLALLGLVLYDVASVGIQLISLGSETLASQGSGDSVSQGTVAASSAMGAVAMSKATGTVWQPGLFVVRLRGIVTDLLGLGDAVFPSLLSTFCLRYDRSATPTNYFAASLVGFGVGCLVCEFVPGIADSGLPALLFIVPSMLTVVGLLLLFRGEIASFWSFDAAHAASDIQDSE